MVFQDIKGSILWMAPEVLIKGTVSRRSDIWSLGCTIIELATAQHPWPDVKDLAQLFRKIEYQEAPMIPQHLSPEFQRFIARCLTYDNMARPSARELLQDPFIASNDTQNECMSPVAVKRAASPASASQQK